MTTHVEQRRRNGMKMATSRQHGTHLQTVSKHEHLCGIVCVDGPLHADASHKGIVALASHSPIAVRTLGSPKINGRFKGLFANSFVCPRLLHSAHIVVPSWRYLNVLNEVRQAVELMCGLHDGAGFDYGDLGQRAYVIHWGPSRAQAGFSVVNGVYSSCLSLVRDLLTAESSVFRVHAPKGAFWIPLHANADPDTDVIDVAIVDDECIVLLARSSRTPGSRHRHHLAVISWGL